MPGHEALDEPTAKPVADEVPAQSADNLSVAALALEKWDDMFDLTERDRELVLVGTIGVLAGLGFSALVGVLGR